MTPKTSPPRGGTTLICAMLLCGLGGCSTAPLAGYLDRFFPGGVRARNLPPGGAGDGAIGIGPPRPFDPLVESPPAPIRTTPGPVGPPPAPRPNSGGDPIPPPTLTNKRPE